MKINPIGSRQNNRNKSNKKVSFEGFANPYTLCGIRKSLEKMHVEEGIISAKGVNTLSAKLWTNLEKLNKYKKNDVVDVHLHPEGNAIWAIIVPSDAILTKRNPIIVSSMKLAHSHVLCTDDEFVSQIDKYAQEIEKDYAHWIK